MDKSEPSKSSWSSVNLSSVNSPRLLRIKSEEGTLRGGVEEDSVSKEAGSPAKALKRADTWLISAKTLLISASLVAEEGYWRMIPIRSCRVAWWRIRCKRSASELMIKEKNKFRKKNKPSFLSKGNSLGQLKLLGKGWRGPSEFTQKVGKRSPGVASRLQRKMSKAPNQ